MGCNETNYIKRLKKKKEDALDFIVDIYLPLVKGVTYKVLSPLRNEGIIEECINDVFLSVWNNSEKFTGDTNDFKKWICAIAKFKAIDYYRKEIKKAEVILEETDVFDNNLVEDEILATEERNELIRVINLLEPMDREIFIMKFFLGMKSELIASKLGVTKASIDNKIYRGKKKLKTKLVNLRLGVM
ncbi:sigma-70 family RNA polymerase sigma factor [Romboutsia sedimentorum]|uniref:Sigma-70 family RNA polymerase sigma factor n=1 Tax=Romboutsia sedimentorum TaxID=1368474 RepID=A0ABT7E628_9FIRM|nr:sigma-70 family RNA polymerase sigma factor [Romboutsia sedimentorum]MDK2562378.1 sigma-70 family RNA polymerase sigma factor [Romboutsia sedimentorum]